MNAAAVGLIGVIVGALLTGVVTLVLERGRRRELARVAGRLIAEELDVVKEKMTSALDADEWWLGDLPTDAWKTHQSHLATDASPDLMAQLARAYAICVSWNDEHALARLSGAMPSEDLHQDPDDIKKARERLKHDNLIRTPGNRQRAVRRSVALAPVLVVLALALAALFAPRADVNSATVAGALQSQLGSSMDVQCQPSGDAWSCTAYPLISSITCPAASALSFPNPRAIEDVVAIASPTAPMGRCTPRCWSDCGIGKNSRSLM
jgi:hypothetical protein